MRTDDLIDCLAADTAPVRPRGLERGMAVVLPLAALAALLGLMLTLGFRPDLVQAAGGGVFWMKAAYTSALAVGGFWLLSRAGRPGKALAAPLILIGAVLATAAALALAQVLLADASQRMVLVMGGSARVCSLNVAGLSVLAAPLIIWAARQFAPLRPGLAGAALGLLVGAVAATVYGLHCPERAPVFIALWYTLGVALTVVVGALAGRRIWRW